MDWDTFFKAKAEYPAVAEDDPNPEWWSKREWFAFLATHAKDGKVSVADLRIFLDLPAN